MTNLSKVNNDLKDIESCLQNEALELRTRLKRGRLLSRILLRLLNRAQHSQVKRSIDRLEQLSGMKFPELTDYQIEYLYRIAYSKAEEFFGRFGNKSPFQKNGLEKDLTLLLMDQFKDDDSSEVIPAIEAGSRLLVGQIPVIGVFVPDILLIGRSPAKGFVATNFEVDGKVHEYLKSEKDELMESCLSELGIFTVRVKANQVHQTYSSPDCVDHNRIFVQKVIEQIKSRQAYEVEQSDLLIKRIKIFTIACWLRPDEIESLLVGRFGEGLNLEAYISLEYYKPYRPKWIRGAKRLLSVLSKLSTGISAKKLYEKQTTPQ